jgi:hypothetical protein
MRVRSILGVVMVVLAIGFAACGSSSSGGTSSTVDPNAAESSPPGDIPDNQAFVAYKSPGGGYSVKVPEGWARTTAGGAVVFTDKLNTISLDSFAGTAPTVAEVKRMDLPQLTKTISGFRSPQVTTAHRPAGTAVKVTYLADSKADPVTGKVTKKAVERYIFFHKGKRLVVTLSGAKGADNVDPWRIVTDSVRWTA